MTDHEEDRVIMTNSYKSIFDAIVAWYSDDWKASRNYFRDKREFENPYYQTAGICWEKKERNRYYIVTSKMCVEYRKRKGHFIRSAYLEELEKVFLSQPLEEKQLRLSAQKWLQETSR